MTPKTLTLSGWGRWPTAEMAAYRPERVREVGRALEAALASGRKIIPHGAGRSYGDQSILTGGAAILTGRLDRYLAFDEATGRLAVEAGVTFTDVLEAFLPRGWMVPVSPGTGFATMGGAVANDVHGKNHDRAGSFGDHVAWVELLLPSGETRKVSADATDEAERRLFRATIGGGGLTGVILSLGLDLKRVPSNAVQLTEERIADLDQFMARLNAVRATATYSVGWIDALATGRDLGRGILEVAEPSPEGLAVVPAKARRVPVDFPSVALNPISVKAFNAFYARRVPAGGQQRHVPVEQFLYPLDALADWNRIYGKRGFHQFQCVIPDAQAPAGIRQLLETVAKSRAASFLAVLKTLGGEGRGMLSFPMRGFTLALDFPHRADTGELLAKLEAITLDQGGRIYLAKDSALSAAGFRRMYPEHAAFADVLREVDPEGRFDSDQARRLKLREDAA